MKDGRDLSEDLDLSFLSNDEEMAIRQVLQRDENLRRQETGRIRRLRLSIPDPKKLKIMTGEWFDELRTRRHGRQSDVTEVVRSSMRRKKTAAPRANPYLDTRKTDNKGEDKKIDSLTTSGKTLNTSFLNPAFREEKVKLDLSGKERTAYTDVTTVDIPEWKTPPHLRPSEQTSREGLGSNPSLPTQHQDIDYFSTAKPPEHSSPKPWTLRALGKASIAVVDPAPESLSTLTTRSDPNQPTKPQPLPQDDITYLESTRILVLPPEIKDDLGQRSPLVSVDPNTWTQPVVDDKFIGTRDKGLTTDKIWAPEKPKRLTLSRDDKQGRSDEHRFAEGHSKPQSVSTLSVSIWEGSNQIIPQPKQEKFRAGYKISVENAFSDDIESSSEERLNFGSGDIEGSDHVELSSITSTVGGANQASPPHLDEVESQPYIFKTTKHVSKKDSQEPKPAKAESHSKLAFSSPPSAPGYNPFSTTDASISAGGQSLQEKSHVPVESKTGTQPVVEDSIIKINTTEKDLTPEITTGVTSTSKEDIEGRSEEHTFVVERSEFQSGSTPSARMWEWSSRTRTQSEQEKSPIGDRILIETPSSGDIESRSEDSINPGSGAFEGSDHTESSFINLPVGGTNQAGQIPNYEVKSKNYTFKTTKHVSKKEIQEPKPVEAESHSELAIRSPQSAPGYNLLSTTDVSMYTEGQSLQEKSLVFREPKTWTQPVVEDNIFKVNTTDKDLTPDMTPTGMTSANKEDIEGRSEEHRFAVERSEFQSGSTPSARMWEWSSRTRTQSEQEKPPIGDRIIIETPSSGEIESRSEDRLNPGSGTFEGSDSSELSFINLPVGANQAGQIPHYEVKSKPFAFKTAKHVSKKEIQEPKPVEDESHSELAFRSPQSAPGYNPFSTTDVPMYTEGHSLQDKSQDLREPKTWTQPLVEDNIIKVKTTEIDLVPDMTPTGMTSANKEDIEGRSEEHRFAVERSEFQSGSTPSARMWEWSSRTRTQSEQEKFPIGDRIIIEKPSSGDIESRSEDRRNPGSGTFEGSKLSSITTPAEGANQRGQLPSYVVKSEPYTFKTAKHVSKKESLEPKPVEAESHSELAFRSPQSAPGYNPFSTTDVSMYTEGQSLQDKSLVFREPKTGTQPVVEDNIIKVNTIVKDLTPEITTGVTSTSKEDIEGRLEEHRFAVERSEFQSGSTPSARMWEWSSRTRTQSEQEKFLIGDRIISERPSSGDIESRSEEIPTARSGSFEGSDRSELSFINPLIGGANQASPPHLDEVTSERYTFKTAKHVSKKDSQERKPAKAESHSELAFSFPPPAPGYNSYSTTEVSMSAGAPKQSLQEKSQRIKAMDKEVAMGDSLAMEKNKSETVKLISSPVHPSFVIRSMKKDFEISSKQNTPAEYRGMAESKDVSILSQDLYHNIEVVGDEPRHTEKDQQVFSGVFDVEKIDNDQIPANVNTEEPTESQTKAINKPAVDEYVKEQERPKEGATVETEMFLIADSVVTKTKSTIPSKAGSQEANQGAGRQPIPTILVSSSQPSATVEVEGSGPRKKLLDASTLGGPSLGNLEDEAMDSDEDDHSSVSSMGSDLSDRRGYGSTLSISGRTGSMLSVYSDAGDFGNVTVQGAVEFALRYSKEGEFIVTVEQCLDLAFANARKKRTDPYVKTYLYPDKSRNSKKKTSIKKRTNNPVYGGETLKYKIKMEELTGRALNLSVWHNDSRGRNVFLGQVEINLKTWDWGHEALTWYNLLPKNSEGQESTEHHGLLTVALKYNPPGSAGNTKPDSGEFHVWLKEARELRKLKSQGVDSFVKCYMLPDTSKKSRQKTRVVKKSQEPVYNHAMVYDGFRKDEIREACCELTVWDQNKLSNQFLGGARLSLGTGISYGKKVDWMDSLNQEIELWEKMLASPNNWVEGEIPLRSAMTPRK